jgi:hypothetical protein
MKIRLRIHMNMSNNDIDEKGEKENKERNNC